MRPLIIVFVCMLHIQVKAQDPLRFLHADSLKRIVSFLASDALRGRASFTKDIDEAAAFLEGEFKQSNLTHIDFYPNYLQPFLDLDLRTPLTKLLVDGMQARREKYYYNSSYYFAQDLKTKDFSFYTFDSVPLNKLIPSLNNLIDSSATPLFVTLSENQQDKFETIVNHQSELSIPSHTIIVCLTDNKRPEVQIGMSEEARQRILFNVIGVLPGQKHPEEMIIISSHYDHVGVGKTTPDSIFNGANDNASGTAAMVSLSKYFAAKKDNDRTILFVAFSGEEIGLRGSTYLSNNIDLNKVKAVFNLEMLGKASDGRGNRLIITEQEPLKSDLYKIMRKYCKDINITEDRYQGQHLFFRSDNYSFAKRGIPAHTFMCYTPNDPTYHKPSDEVSTLDFQNMSALVKGLLPGIEAVVSGKETPIR